MLRGIVAAVSEAVGGAEHPKISLSRFREGDVALFMPCGNEQVDRHGNTLCGSVLWRACWCCGVGVGVGVCGYEWTSMATQCAAACCGGGDVVC